MSIFRTVLDHHIWGTDKILPSLNLRVCHHSQAPVLILSESQSGLVDRKIGEEEQLPTQLEDLVYMSTGRGLNFSQIFGTKMICFLPPTHIINFCLNAVRQIILSCKSITADLWKTTPV